MTAWPRLGSDGRFFWQRQWWALAAQLTRKDVLWVLNKSKRVGATHQRPPTVLLLLVKNPDDGVGETARTAVQTTIGGCRDDRRGPGDNAADGRLSIRRRGVPPLMTCPVF
jgi:hypothetical protein